jgi:hypothetical protein
VPEQERNLIDTFAGQKSPGDDGVPKGCIDGRTPARSGTLLSVVVLLVEDPVHGPSVGVDPRFCASRRVRATFRCCSGRPVPVANTKPSGAVSLLASR